MSRRIDDDASEIFWPGYVDAVTNLVLNLLFVVVIMTVAVFMFAMQLARMEPRRQLDAPESTQSTPTASSPSLQPEAQDSKASQSAPAEALKAKEAQVASLQNRIQSLEAEIRQQAKQATRASSASSASSASATTHATRSEASEAPRAAGEGPQSASQVGSSAGNSTDPSRVITATATEKAPERGLEKAVPAGTTGGIVVKFADDAIALTRAESDELRKALAPLASGGARIEVVVPAGFSEAKRLGFYRAMAVRNHLIELKVPANRIEIQVRDGKQSADSSRVMVTPR